MRAQNAGAPSAKSHGDWIGNWWFIGYAIYVFLLVPEGSQIVNTRATMIRQFHGDGSLP